MENPDPSFENGDFQMTPIFNGLQPSKMAARPCAALVLVGIRALWTRTSQTGLLLLVCAFSATGAEGLSPERLDWMLNCQGCHLADGTGSPGLVPPVKDFAARFLSVPGGREFLVQVPGVATSPLSDEAIARLMNWMLSEFDAEHLPDDFRPYTRAEVSRLRTNPVREDLSGVRERLVTEISLREPGQP